MGADKLTVKYIDEQDKPQTLTVSKDPESGEWKGDNLPQGVDVDAKTGKVTLTPGAVKDNSDVIATNSGGSETSPEAKGQAGEGGNTPPTPQPGEPTVTISGSETVEEGSTATYKVTLSQPSDKDVTVKVTLKHNETDDSDFNPAPEITKTLTIKAGQTSAEFTLHPVDDQKAEDKETYSLTLSEPQGAKLGDQTSVTTAITDKGTTPPADDAQVKAINAPTAEEGQPLVYEVTVDTPKADTTVTLTLKSGTATLGTDTGTPVETSTDGGQTWQTVTPDANGSFTATVPAGSDKGVQVRVPTVVDTEVEGKETLTLEAAATGQTTPVSGEGTITDAANNTPPQAPQIADGEAKGSVTITPDANADSLKVSYEDENGDKHTLELHKENGKWVPKETLPTDVKLDETSGKVTLEPNAVKDGSDVSATNGHGGADSDAATHQAGTDEAEVIQGNATSEAIAADKVGLSGEYYGYNDDSIDRLVQNDPKVAANVRYHADDKTSNVNMPGFPANNLYDLDFTERMINGRNGSKVTGEIKSAAEGTPDARFTVTDINYGGKAAVSSGLANNEKTAVGQGLSQSSALRNFLDVNGAEDADSARVEAGAPYKGTSGLGYTTDAAVRIVGHVYFGEGTYDFKFALDNGATVRIDGKDIYKDFSISEADTLGKHPNGIHLTEGVHSVEVIYLEEGSVSTLHMQYKAHGAADSSYQTMGLDNNLMLKPEASLDLNQLQDVHNTGTANNPAWHVRTGATLDGGEGKDDITGSEGRDFIYGHGGNDSLTGGKGGDTFIYNTKAANGHDVIKDFKIGEDKISLTDLLDTKSIDAKAPGWKGLSEIQNAQWDDSAHKLSFDTTDGAKTYHNSITFEGMTQSYNSVDDFLRENGNGII